MKKTLSLVILLTFGLGWVHAQDATALQVAPSDQVKYPDASQILNKTETPAPAATSTTPATSAAPATPVSATPPAAAAAATPVSTTPAAETTPAVDAAAAGALPTTRPLVATAPVPARSPAARGSATEPTAHGWFLRWTLTGDEAGVQTWVKELGLPATVQPVSPGQWEVWAGPLDSATLSAAVKGQGGVATLVRR